MSEYIGVSVALDMNRDDFEEAFMHVNLTVRKVLCDLPLDEVDCGYGFGTRDFEFKVLEGDTEEMRKTIQDRVREAGLEVVEMG